MSRHSSENIGPEEFKAQWNKIMGLMEEDLVVAERHLERMIAERKKAVDAAKLATQQVKVLKSKIDDMKKSRNRGEKPKES